MKGNTIQSILIDNREPLWMQRMDIDGVPVVVTQLQCADVWLAASDGALLLVERKTADDLLASIADGRLFDQAAAMVQTSPWSYVVVTGAMVPDSNGKTLSGRNPTNWQWSAVQGALQTIQELGVTIIHLSDNQAEFVRFLQRLAERDRGPMRAAGVRKPELLAPGMTVLMSLPGIGGDRAKSLLEQLSGAGWALEYLTDENWQSHHIQGIGDGLRAKVREALGLPDGAKLAVVTECADNEPAAEVTSKTYGMAEANADLF